MLKKITFSAFIVITTVILSLLIIIQLQKKEYKIISESNEKQIELFITEINSKIESKINAEFEKIKLLGNIIITNLNNFSNFSKLALTEEKSSFVMFISNEGIIEFTYPDKKINGFSILNFPDIANFFLDLKKNGDKKASFLTVKRFDRELNTFKTETFLALGIKIKVRHINYFFIKFTPYSDFFQEIIDKSNKLLGKSAIIYLKEMENEKSYKKVFKFDIYGLTYFIAIKNLNSSSMQSLNEHFKKINTLIVSLIIFLLFMGALTILSLFTSHQNLENIIKKRSQELYIEREKYLNLFNNLPLPSLIIDSTDLKIIESNKIAKEYGFHEGKNIENFFEPKLIKNIFVNLKDKSDKKFLLNSKDNKNFEIYSISVDKNNIFMLLNDITMQNKLEEKLQKAQKHEIISTITSGITHDLKNVLNNIKIYIGLLEKGAQNKDEVIKTLKTILDTAKEHFETILMISKQRTPPAQKVSTEELMKNFLSIVRDYIPKNIEVTYLNLIPEKKLFIPKGSFIQALINIIINSVEAINGKDGEITILVDKEDKKLKQFAKITIKDNGPGIEPEILNNITKPFFTTKKEGCGLGLAVVKKIITEANGYLEIESEPNHGVTVRIFIPIGES